MRLRRLVGDGRGGAALPLLALAALFIALNSVALGLALPTIGLWTSARLFAVWGVTTAIGWGVLRRARPQYDALLFGVYALLTGWGLLLQERLAPNFSARQQLWFVLGMAVLVGMAIGPRTLRPLRHYRYTLLLGGLLLLALTLVFGVNPAGQGATLWLRVPLLNVYFQPSELLKLLLAIFFASYFADRERVITARQAQGWAGSLPYIAPLLLMWGFCMILLVWQRDLGAATIYFALFLTQLYTATGKRRYIAIGLGLLLSAGVVGYYAYDLVALRIEAWVNPWADVYNRSFQVVQSLYALAAGGVLGQGVGQGAPTLIPVVHSDFVFAAIGEEWGLVGTLTTVACFALIAQRGLRIALRAINSFRLYLAIGITMLISVQAFLIMGGVTRLLPLTGVTLPLVSYGGTSMLLSSLMIGLLLYLDADRPAN